MTRLSFGRLASAELSFGCLASAEDASGLEPLAPLPDRNTAGIDDSAVIEDKKVYLDSYIMISVLLGSFCHRAAATSESSVPSTASKGANSTSRGMNMMSGIMDLLGRDERKYLLACWSTLAGSEPAWPW